MLKLLLETCLKAQIKAVELQNTIPTVNALSDLGFMVKMAIFKMAAMKNLTSSKIVIESWLMAQMKGDGL